jgi:hypothetical protein
MLTLVLIWSVSVVVVPPVILSASHGADSTSDQVRVPPVGFDRVIVFAVGFSPPAVPEKLIVVGLREMLGMGVVVPVVTIMVTGTVAV